MMRKIFSTFFINVAAVFAFVTVHNDGVLAASTDRYFISGDPATTGAWSLTSGGATGASVPADSTDIFIDNGSSAAFTATANLAVKTITIAATNSQNNTFAGYTIRTKYGVSNSGTGTLNWGNALYLDSTGALLTVVTGAGSQTATSCDIYVGVSATATMGKIMYWKSANIAASATLVSGGTYQLYTKSATTPWVMGNNSTYTTNTGFNPWITAKGNLYTIGTGCTINGAGPLIFYGPQADTCFLPALTTTISTYIQLDGSNADSRFTFTGNLTANSANQILFRFSAASSSNTVNTGAYNLSGKAFVCGTTSATATANLNFGTGTHTLQTFAVTNITGTNNINLQNSVWKMSYHWTWPNHAGTTVSHGNDSVIFNGTSAQTITSNGKAFKNLKILNTGASVVVKSVDSLTILGDLTITDGRDSLVKTRCENLSITTTDSTFLRDSLYVNDSAYIGSTAKVAGIGPIVLNTACSLIGGNGSLPTIVIKNNGCFSAVLDSLVLTRGTVGDSVRAYITNARPGFDTMWIGSTKALYNNHTTYYTIFMPAGSGIVNVIVGDTAHPQNRDTLPFSYDTIAVLVSASPATGNFRQSTLCSLTTTGGTHIDTAWVGDSACVIASKAEALVVVTVRPAVAVRGPVDIRTAGQYGYRDTLPNAWSWVNRDTIPTLIYSSPTYSKESGGGQGFIVGTGLTQITDSLFAGDSLSVIDSAHYDTLWYTLPAHRRGATTIRTVSQYGYQAAIAGPTYGDLILRSATPAKGKIGDTITLAALWGLGTSGLGVTVGDSTSTILAGYNDTLARVIAPTHGSGSVTIRAIHTSDTGAIGWRYGGGSKKHGGFLGLGGWLGL
jgi:hypothetical protein